MGKFLLGLAEVTLSMSAVIALLLLGARAWGKRFAYRWRYLAWLVVAIRLAVPLNLPLPKAPLTVPVPAAPVVAAPPANALIPIPEGVTLPEPWDSTIPPELYQVAEPLAAEPEPMSVGTVLFALWAAGAGVFLAAQLGGYAALRRSVRRWGREAGAYGGLRVVESPKIASPLLAGFFRPVIVLPEGMGEAERDFALLHEATHARRRDLWYKLLLVWGNALHWFNPLVWALRRAAAGDVELACDEALLRGRDEDYRRAYGAALVARAAERSRGAALTSAFSGSRGSLRARVLALLDMAPKRSGRMALAAVCVLALTGGALVACRPVYRTMEADWEAFPALGFRLKVDWEDEDAIPTALSFLPMELTDPVTGTGYYRVPEAWDEDALTTLPIAADASYGDFPDTLPNSDNARHPGRILAMQQMLSSRMYPTFPVTLTVKEGVIVGLSPTADLFELTDGVAVSFLDGPADEKGLVRYENGTYGFSLSIPEATARRLAVLTAPGMALGEGGDAGSGVGSVLFLDRRLMGDKAAMLIRNRLGCTAVLCPPVEPGPGGAEVYPPALVPGRMDQAELERMAGISAEVAAQVVADGGVMAGLTVERLGSDGPEAGWTAGGLQMDAAFGAGTFLNFHSRNPGDGSIRAEWDEFSGAYHGYSLRVTEERTVTLTCASSENVAMTLIFPDGTEQTLSAGENETVLPAGTTQLELKATGGAGSFSVEVSPHEGITING